MSDKLLLHPPRSIFIQITPCFRLRVSSETMGPLGYAPQCTARTYRYPYEEPNIFQKEVAKLRVFLDIAAIDVFLCVIRYRSL